ncbi:MAG: hypothetical protein AAF657_36135 [Acidobacteriota bacterium]
MPERPSVRRHPRQGNASPHESDPLHQRLRQLRIEGPPPTLATRVSGAVRETLADQARVQSAGRLGWGLEALCVGAILLCLLALPAIAPNGHDDRQAAPVATLDSDLVRQLDLDDDLAANVRLRLAFQAEAHTRQRTHHVYNRNLSL